MESQDGDTHTKIRIKALERIGRAQNYQLLKT